MTPKKVRAAADRLDTLHEEVVPCFGRREAREHSRVYLRGLLLHDQRKNVESIALHFAPGRDGAPAGDREVEALQNFITDSPWDYHEVQGKLQTMFARELVPSAAPSPIGVVGVFDETGDEKSGLESCGASQQWFGRLGKTEVCQVGVFLIGVVPAGMALLDHQLFLPKACAVDPAHRLKTRVPADIVFRSKPQLAIELLRRTLAQGQVKFDWITADSLYGKSGEFLDGLEELQQRYAVETASDTVFWTQDPATQIPPYCGQGAQPTRATRKSVQSCAVIAAQLPVSAWQPIKLREGAKGPLVAEFARVRVWASRHNQPGPAVWLVFRRELGSSTTKFYVSNAEEAIPLETLALVIATRFRVEEFFEDAKQYLGMADYEVRGWTSWHHHMSLVGLAHFYIVLTRGDLQEEAAELTFDRAFRLICDALARPRLTSAESLRLTDYYLHHNKLACESHRKRWLKEHPDLAQKLRL